MKLSQRLFKDSHVGNGHEKIDEIGNHQKAYGAGMKTSIALREFNRSRDEINFNFHEMWFLIFILVIQCVGGSTSNDKKKAESEIKDEWDQNFRRSHDIISRVAQKTKRQNRGFLFLKLGANVYLAVDSWSR